MKRSILLKASFALLVGLFSMNVLAQSPLQLNYQAVVRDVSGNPITDTGVEVVLTIRQYTSDGSDIFVETHNVTTNGYGLINLVIGSIEDLGVVPWGDGPFFLKVDVEGSEIGITQLLSVPYSLYSEAAANVFSGVYNDLSGKPDLSGFISSELDPVFGSSAAKGISAGNITNWNTAYSWGNHSTAGYLTSSPWQLNSDKLSYNNGYVGVGVEDPRSKLAVQGKTAEDSILFEVKNSLGQTVFAVYNQGVHITIDEDYSKGARGGFSVGGFDRTKGIQEYMRVTADSTRVYVNQNASKGARGGFSVGGFDRTKGKGATFNYVTLTPENYLIGHSAGSNLTSGTKNFFAGYEAGMMNDIGSNNIMVGFAAGKISTGSLNVFIGTESGTNNTTGWGNVFIGEKSGYNNVGGAGTQGARNVILGFNAGYENTTGGDNVYIGTVAGSDMTTGRYNTMVGCEAGDFAESGDADVYVGHRAGYNNDGSSNVIIGELAGANKNMYSTPSTTFDNSVFVGAYSGYSVTSGDYNTFLGRSSGVNTTTGAYNTFLGAQAGTSANGSRNVFIGYRAGYSETGSDKLYIANSNTSAPLIWGDFNTEAVKINGSFTVGTGSGSDDIVLDGNSGLLETVYREGGSYKAGMGWDVTNDRFYMYDGTNNALFAKYGHVGINGRAPHATYALDVNGTLRVNTTLYTSDRRYKNEIELIDNPLEKVMSIEGVYFSWDKKNFPEISFEDKRQIGFIAQDMEKILPEVVSFDDEGYGSVEYPKVTALLVEAIKEQQNKILRLSKKLEDRDKGILELEERLRTTEEKINLILESMK